MNTLSSPFIRALTCAAIGALIAISCDPARAESWEMPNEAGGKIILTTRPCSFPDAASLMGAYTYGRDWNMIVGCWAVIDGLVHVSWGQGRRRVFPIESFTLSKPIEPQPVQRQQRQTPKSL